VGILSAFVGIALVVALSPKSDPAKAASPNLTDAPNKDIALPDSVRDAPENNANLRQSPRLGPPLHGEQPGPAGAGPSEGPRQAMREERIKALSSPILVEMENPTLADQGDQPLTHGPAAAGASALASPDGVPGASAPPAPIATLAAGTADPNMQQHKNDFLTRDGLNNTSYVSQEIATPRSPYEVKAGTVIPLSLITGINSDLPGQIVGQVRENVYDTVTDEHLLVPQGTKLFGKYDSVVAFGQKRALVVWTRLILPNGNSIVIENLPATDVAGYAGLEDEVDFHTWQLLKGIGLATLLGVGTQLSLGNDESDLLKALPVVAALTACRRALPYRPADFARPARSTVAILDAPNYSIDLADVISRGIRELAFDVRGRSVLLKPNLIEYEPGRLINTNPLILIGRTIVVNPRITSVTFSQDPYARYAYLRLK